MIGPTSISHGLPLKRRDFITAVGAAMALPLGAGQSRGVPTDLVRRPILSSGELIPAIGMGTWLTFNVGRSELAQRSRRDVLAAFLAGGGTASDQKRRLGGKEMAQISELDDHLRVVCGMLQAEGDGARLANLRTCGDFLGGQ